MKLILSLVSYFALVGFGRCQNCEENQFSCDKDKCIPYTWVCDGYRDCYDKSDEPCDSDQCPACEEEQFRCTNGKCINDDEVCDGIPSCFDGSDEDPWTCHCDESTFNCAGDDDDEYIPCELVCDGREDCIDGYDEDVCPASFGRAKNLKQTKRDGFRRLRKLDHTRK